MAVEVTTLQPRVLYRLRLTQVAGELELLRWTFAVDETPESITSPSAGLPDSLLSYLKHRLQRLTSGIPADAVPDQPQLLAALLSLREGTGTLSFDVAPGDGFVGLVVGGADPGTAYYVFLSLPHSVDSPLC